MTRFIFLSLITFVCSAPAVTLTDNAQKYSCPSGFKAVSLANSESVSCAKEKVFRLASICPSGYDLVIVGKDVCRSVATGSTVASLMASVPSGFPRSGYTRLVKLVGIDSFELIAKEYVEPISYVSPTSYDRDIRFFPNGSRCDRDDEVLKSFDCDFNAKLDMLYAIPNFLDPGVFPAHTFRLQD
jgi:hypothetical protein